MTNSGPEPDAPNAGKIAANEEGISPELAEQFRLLEARVEEAVRLIVQLKKDKQELEARLDEASRTRSEAARRIDELIDKIDGLL